VLSKIKALIITLLVMAAIYAAIILVPFLLLIGVTGIVGAVIYASLIQPKSEDDD